MQIFGIIAMELSMVVVIHIARPNVRQRRPTHDVAATSKPS